jgi:restriction system protein
MPGAVSLARHPNGIVEADLEEIPGYSPVDSWTKTTTGIADTEASVSQASAELSPQERAEEAIGEMDAEVAEDLLTRLHNKDPAFFEQAVVDLLVAMGYGGADGRARVTQQSNDGGIDGIIDQDPLGLNACTSRRSGTPATIPWAPPRCRDLWGR